MIQTPTLSECVARMRSRGWDETDGVFTRPAPKAAPHVHSAVCSQDICPGATYTCSSARCVVGKKVVCPGHSAPTREAMIRSSLLRRLDSGGEFLHYTKTQVEAMR